MQLTNDQKKQYKAIAHNLNPVVIIGENAISEGLMNELERALNDHELIKVKINVGEREDRQEIIEHLIENTGATLVQKIGKIAVLLRKNKKPNPKLSNLLRQQHS
jgi:RNA-binding protein